MRKNIKTDFWDKLTVNQQQNLITLGIGVVLFAIWIYLLLSGTQIA